MENATIHGIASNRCPTCITPVEKLSEYSETGSPCHSHADYATAYQKSDTISLNEYGIKNINNALWSVPNLNPPDLVRADILHNILLGVLAHLMEWIQGFLEHNKRINMFDYMWHQLPPYPGFSVPMKAYQVVSQWSGKEMRNFARVILGTFTAALQFNKGIFCVRSLTDFYLMTQYPSHTNETISYLRQYLRDFHETKDVFLRFRAGKRAKKAAAILKDGAHYNFLKIHLISHYAEQIPKFGALGQYSTDISEAMLKGFKDAYRRSNKVDATPQIITTYTR
ncbi:hypothetical protein BGX38DRAFT_1106458, partial [Terfezia claveryi]